MGRTLVANKLLAGSACGKRQRGRPLNSVVRHHENMRCYNHPDQEAVGICRSCGRGLCPGCAAEVEKAVACRDRCESDVVTILKLNRNALQYAKNMKQARYLAPTMIVVIGAVLTTLGMTYDRIAWAIFVGGIIMAIGVAFLVIKYGLAKGLKA